MTERMDKRIKAHANANEEICPRTNAAKPPNPADFPANHLPIYNIEDLSDAAKTRGLVLYGTGYVAEMIFQGLDARNLWSHVSACIVTEEPGSESRFHDVPVFSVASWATQQEINPLVCLAAHEAIASEMARSARAHGITDIAWVYPIAHELLFGPPLRRSANLSVSSLLAAQPKEWHWIAARACALEQADMEIESHAADGTSAYVKCMELHCGKGTAQKRLERFRELAADVEQRGFDPSRPILVDERLRIIDGLHRVALAWRCGVKSLPSDIVSASDAYDQLFTENNKLTPAALVRAGLTRKERALIDKLQRQILESVTEQNGAHSGNPVLPRECKCESPQVSIIMPVYNVAEYMDQCLESVAAQTFDDFEVLLIDDGSTDGSDAKCDHWAAKDMRIRVIHQANCGVSSARNCGIEQARGTYLAFVDPDDWLDSRYLEKLHERAVTTGADFVECDIWRYNGRNGSKIWRHCGQRMGIPYTIAEHMKYGPTASYKAISLRTLWVENDIRFPACAFESPAVYALVLALASRVEYIPEPLYYYRRFRENSLVETGYANRDGSANNTLGVEAMEHLVNEFAAHGLLDRYGEHLPGIVLWRLNDILAMQYHRKSRYDFAEMMANYRDFVTRFLPQTENRPYITWGGYNLNKICQHMDMLHDPSCRFNFSSLTSIAQPGSAHCGVHHANRYRQMMVQREIDWEFWNVLDSQQPAFLVMDLLEERFDLVKWQDRFLTASDAWEGAELDEAHEVRVIPRESDECTRLFLESLDTIASRLATDHPQLRIIMVENYLAEEAGDLNSRDEFAEIEQIRSTNKLLARLYDAACDTLPNVVRIPAYQQDCYFTDSHYEYGAVPQHLNAIVNQNIGKLVEQSMRCASLPTISQEE